MSLTISKQYGLKIPINIIREVAGTDKQGTNALGVRFPLYRLLYDYGVPVTINTDDLLIFNSILSDE